MNTKEYTYQILKKLGYSGNKTELRKEYKNLFVIIKAQKSRFGEHVYLNIGILYKAFLKARTPKFKDCQLEFRFRQMLMALKKKQYQFGKDDEFHLAQNVNIFKKNLNIILEKLISELDN